jgi:CD63 antigen
MFTCGEKFVKFLMVFFNFLFVVCGIGLMAAGGIAQASMDKWYLFISNGAITGPALVIVVGVFLFLVAFFGCCGALKEHYCMLMTYSGIVGFIMLLQFAGGIAALVQKNQVENWVQQNFQMYVSNYTTDTISKDLVDQFQKEEKCCGATNYTDYKDPLSKENPITVPSSCCINNTPCNRTQEYLSEHCTKDKKDSQCPIYTEGCQSHLTDILEVAIAAAGGAAIGLAFFELIGVLFACYLARGIRNGYV